MADNLFTFNDFGKNIFITGANSGIGFYSTLYFLKKENYLFIPIRSSERKKNFFKKLTNYFEIEFLNKHLNIIENIDFDDLNNIKKLEKYFKTNKLNLDILILNAGLQYTGSSYPKVSKQGIELTFAVNHLAHFYLTDSLMKFINDFSESRIVVTSSDVHNPKSSGGNVGEKATLNNLINFEDEIMGKFINFNADRSYKNSKLCNILFAKELSKRLRDKKSNISVITWAPGLVIPEDDLGFFRYSSFYNKIGYQLFSILARDVLGISAKVEDAGEKLYQIAFKKDFNDIGYVHLSNKLVSYKKHVLKKDDISKEASDSELAIKLWNLSEKICQSFGFSIFNL
tara:strand:- start:5029 stop:6054 length:1026 start_codon:yes stop_codon:yes gene_type:complete